jgi:hypothetical protein
MTATAPPASRPTPVPPEEQFWKRYSPHHEFPLSGAGSVALHLLGLGALLLLVVGIIPNWLGRAKYSLPVEPVLLAPGGDQKPAGPGNGPGAGRPKEDLPDPKATRREGKEAHTNTLGLRRPPVPEPESRLIEPDGRPIQKRDRELEDIWKKLHEFAKKPVEGAGPPAGRKDRPGAGGKDAVGRGPGTGPGTGRTGKLTERQQRMLRWSMRFNTADGADYVRQLNGLGAIVAIPVKEGPKPEYRVVRDLAKRPAKLKEQDLSKINRIFWIDDNPRSVAQVMQALGRPDLRPSRFVAFMPEELEKKLYELEKDYVVKELKQPYDEQRIAETRFKVVKDGGRFRPEIVDVRLNP